MLLLASLMMALVQAQPTDIGPAYRVGGGVSAPKLIAKKEPGYTEEARKAHVNTSVTLLITVTKEGRAANVRVTRAAGFGLDEEAVSVVTNYWRFEPGRKDGEPVNIMANIDVNFRLLDKKNEHAGQIVRLTFTEATAPQMNPRPVLTKGIMPFSPLHLPAHLRVGIRVATTGEVVDVQVLESTDETWTAAALRQIQEWKFRPGAVEMNGLLDITAGQPVPAKPLNPAPDSILKN